MKVYHALNILRNTPLDWRVLWGDSDNILHPVLDVYYDSKLHKAFVILFKEGDLDAHKNESSVKDFYNMLLNLPTSSFDSDLVFNNFQETNHANAGMFESTSEILRVKGFRRAKYTEYDYTLKQYKKHHYVRMMLFNDAIDRRG